MHVYVYVCMYVCICMYVWSDPVGWIVHACIHTYIHTYKAEAYVHVYLRVLQIAWGRLVSWIQGLLHVHAHTHICMHTSK